MKIPLHSQANILLVDDKEVNLFLLEKLLRQQGYCNIESTTDPRKVISLVHNNMPDIILLDLMMPHLDGFGVMMQLKNIVAKDDYLPILILTANSNETAKKRALKEGAMDFLIKPFDKYEVLQRTHNLLNTRFLYKEQQTYSATLEEMVYKRTRELMQSNNKLKTANNALEKANLEILSRLARASEYRDDDTGEHTLRVGEMSYLTAKNLKLDQGRAKLILHAARLHDLGKIAIPDTILLKPGKLSDVEMATMKTHSAIGADLLADGDSALLCMAETIALTHHERFDGSGYPKGLKGENIPIEGRIVAVVDVYDALTHERPYKPAWPQEKAIQLLKKERGHHFDPEVVNAFLAVLNDQQNLPDEASIPKSQHLQSIKTFVSKL